MHTERNESCTAYRLRRHPLPIVARFRHVLVLSYAVGREALEPWLPPGLGVDTFGGLGFVAVAMVQTERLRPAFLPAGWGGDFFLSGYRLFARFRRRRGLHILRSVTDSRWVCIAGNLLTHYNYRREAVRVVQRNRSLRIAIGTELDVEADLASIPAPLPLGSPFRNLAEARRFAGPLPFTFDYEPETHSIIVIEAVRQNWNPRPVRVTVRQNEFIESFPQPVLANAFYLADVPYRWNRGVREAL